MSSNLTANPAAAANPPTAADPTAVADPPAADPARPRLSKEERRSLLARIEREASRAEAPERILQRADQALQSGNITQVERLVAQLELKVPDLLGLDNLKVRMVEAQNQLKLQANIRKAEDMLLRYIEDRKKMLAELALGTLAEIAPDHPKLGEYRIWVQDLDLEAEAHEQLAVELSAGRTALQVGNLDVARRHLETLRGLNADAPATLQLASEISQAEAGQAESADIASTRQRFEECLRALDIATAEKELERLSHHAVAKITLDQMRQQLEQAKTAELGQREMAAFEELFERYVSQHRWQEARDIARSAGQKFSGHPRPAEMFSQVGLHEAKERQQDSTRQGLETLQAFIAEGKKSDAQLALKLLNGKIDAELLAHYEERVNALT